jgi:hypothetical protein
VEHQQPSQTPCLATLVQQPIFVQQADLGSFSLDKLVPLQRHPPLVHVLQLKRISSDGQEEIVGPKQVLVPMAHQEQLLPTGIKVQRLMFVPMGLGKNNQVQPAKNK